MECDLKQHKYYQKLAGTFKKMDLEALKDEIESKCLQIPDTPKILILNKSYILQLNISQEDLESYKFHADLNKAKNCLNNMNKHKIKIQLSNYLKTHSWTWLSLLMRPTITSKWLKKQKGCRNRWYLPQLDYTPQSITNSNYFPDKILLKYIP